MRAILVCVDYADLLSVTLPYNKHHFQSITVVTSPRDKKTIEVCQRNSVMTFQTEAFYEGGAVFNKWLALELGLSYIGRYGWLCIMDADVLWPQYVPQFQKNIGSIYTPKRRMMEDLSQKLPQEPYWKSFPLHPGTEFAGYTQIFHAEDPHLGSKPWHETNWKHAGGADSFFQMKWPEVQKVRPPFEVLHLGPAGKNWCGRATPYLDGSLPEDSGEKLSTLSQFIVGRYGKDGQDRFAHERL